MEQWDLWLGDLKNSSLLASLSGTPLCHPEATVGPRYASVTFALSKQRARLGAVGKGGGELGVLVAPGGPQVTHPGWRVCAHILRSVRIGTCKGSCAPGWTQLGGAVSWHKSIAFEYISVTTKPFAPGAGCSVAYS